MVSEFEFCETSTLNISPINSYVSILLPIKNLWEHNRWNHWFLHDEQWPKYEEVCFVVHYSSNASIGMWNQLLRLNREFCVLHESKVSVVADEEEQVKGAPRNWEQMNDTHVSRQRSWLFLKTVGSEKILVRSINFKFIKS